MTQRNTCFYNYNKNFFVIHKKYKTFPDTLKELEESFKYEEYHILKIILKQLEKYKFPISVDKNCMIAVFAFDLETCNVENQVYCDAYSAGVYHLNRLYESFKGDLTQKIEIEREHVHIFDRGNANPVLDMINYVINNYKGTPKIFTDRYERKIVSSFKYQVVGQDSSGFDNYTVSSSLAKSYTKVKILKTSNDSITLSLRAGSLREDDRELPKYVKCVCSKCHISGSLKEK